MRSLLAAILLASALSACAQQGDLGDVHQGPPFRFDISALPTIGHDDYQAAFTEAVNRWNQALGKQLLFVADKGALKVSFANTPAEKSGAHTDDFGNITFQPGGWPICWDANSSYSSKDFLSVAQHEIGHVLGAYFPENPEDPIHSPDAADIMYKHANSCLKLSARDVAAVSW